jgi:4-aminobutyrate aminotransferase/(S)-3-amino-2-methylpropionate transaminase
VYHIPFPIPFHGGSTAASLSALEQVFKTEAEPGRIAAIIVEPVLGEGGFYVAPGDFLPALRAICDQHGILLICDEIQTGFARTGRMFASEHYGIEPDLITLAKSLGGGFPLAAIVGKAPIMDAPVVGGLGGTYAASPIACAAALAVLDVMKDEGLPARSQKIGDRIRNRLQRMQANLPCIGEVRGLGGMIAIELVRNRDAQQPDVDLTKALVQRCATNGLVLLSCGIYSNVIRFLPPLTISDGLLDEGLAVLERTLTDLTNAK